MQIISSVAGSARAATENQWESFDYGRGPCPGTRRAPKAGVQLLEGTGWPHQGINVTICVFGLRPNTCQKTIMTSRVEYHLAFCIGILENPGLKRGGCKLGQAGTLSSPHVLWRHLEVF